VNALVEREDRAAGEEHDRNHERVEVPLAAEPEWVLLGLRLGRPAPPQQEQGLIGAVGDGVHGLGQHRGRPGDGERDELRGRDAQVRGERGQDRPQAG
jgi:hypothetical protein